MSDTARAATDKADIRPTIRNDALHNLLRDVTGIEPTWTSDVRANPFGWLLLERPEQLRDVAKALAGKVRLCTVTAYAVARDDADRRRRVAYHFASGDTIITVTVPLFDPQTLKKLPVPSITPWFRNADWSEREFREMFNIEVLDHPNPKRLFLDERLDAGIMTRLIPFSAMANSAGTNMLWERILEAKGVPPEDRMPSLAAPAEPITVEPKVTPVAASEAKEKTPGSATLADLAMSPDAFVEARAKEKAALAAQAAEKQAAPGETEETRTDQKAAPEDKTQAAPEKTPAPDVAAASAKKAAPAEAPSEAGPAPETVQADGARPSGEKPSEPVPAPKAQAKPEPAAQAVTTEKTDAVQAKAVATEKTEAAQAKADKAGPAPAPPTIITPAKAQSRKKPGAPASKSTPAKPKKSGPTGK